MNNLKLGFIGYGRHARTNLYPSLKVLGYRLAAVATNHEESAKQASADYGISNYYVGHETLLGKEKLDAVFVSAQPNDQLKIVKDALLAGCHVFAEKPLGMNVAEAEEVAALSTKQNKQVMVGFMKRFAPAYMKVKEKIGEKEFGEALGITQFFTSRNFAKNPTEYLLFAASHYVDLLRWYFGEVEQVSGFANTDETQSLMSYSLRFKNGVLASLQYCGAPSWERAAHEMTITGTNGYVRVSGVDQVKVYSKDTNMSVPRWQGLEENEQTFGTMLTTSGGGQASLYLNGFVGELKHFVESIEAGKPVENSSEENVKTMRLIDKLVAVSM